jgi:hypothetical protein
MSELELLEGSNSKKKRKINWKEKNKYIYFS